MAKCEDASGQISRPSFHLAARTDGDPGNGTFANPFDASSNEKFDELLAAFPENSVIHLGAGEFETGGSRTVTLKSGMTIRGQGMHATVVRLVNIDGSGKAAVFGASDQHFERISILDLTVDCNHPGNPKLASDVAISGIELAGSYHRIERVRAINSYGNLKSGLECFVLAILAFDQDTEANWIKDCLIEQTLGDYTVGALIGGNPNVPNDFHSGGPYICRGGGIVGNTFCGIGWLAVSAGGNDGLLVANNVAIDCGFLFRWDTSTLKSCVISNNSARVNLHGIQLIPTLVPPEDGPWADSITISGNTFEMVGSGIRLKPDLSIQGLAGYGILLQGGSASHLLERILVVNNSFRWVEPAPGVKWITDPPETYTGGLATGNVSQIEGAKGGVGFAIDRNIEGVTYVVDGATSVGDEHGGRSSPLLRATE